MPGFKKGKLLVALRGIPGWWDYDRFIPASVEFDLEQQWQDALK
jgi:hypothetical protein